MKLSPLANTRCIGRVFVFLILTHSAKSQSLGPAPSIAELQFIPGATNTWTKIAQATGNGWMHFPRGYAFDIQSGGNIVKKVLVNWSTSPDSVMFPYTHGWTGSIDGGLTWNTPAPTNTPNIDQMSCIRRHDGVLIAIPFYPNPFTGANPTDSFTFSYDSSIDNGVTWHKNVNGAVVKGFGGQKMGSFRFHRGIIQDANGDLYAPAYCQFQITGGYESHRVILLKSTDKGITWNYLSTVQATSGLSYNEATIVRCRDGSILCVMRNGSNPLKYRRSTDNGASWGGAVNFLSGLPSHTGVDPYLYLMPNGVLVLSYGDNVPGNMRHCYLAFAADGVGNSWTNVTNTFLSSTSGLGNKSSGYTAIWPTRINRFQQVSDRALWTYYGSSRHPSPNPFSIWTKQVDMVLDHRNRIDLKTKYANGDITVTTDLNYTNTAHPEARVSGAFDGSTDYWSSAWKNGSSGYMTIDLGKETLLNAVGVCLANGLPQSGSVEYSQDGSSWATIRTYPSGTVHYTIDYTTLSSPVQARYVRVNVSGGTLTGLNEIRLFSVADTYEDYAQNVAPYGYVMLNTGFWVSEGVAPFPTGYKSQRALYMYDADSNNKEITKTFSAGSQKTLEFWLRVKAFASSNGAIQWRLVSGSTNAFRMRVASGGIVQWYNGSNYVTISGANIPMDTWVHIKVTANATTGSGVLTINGVNSYTIGKEATVSSLNGFRFASGGAAAIGDAALFDDVAFYDTPSSLMARTSTPTPDFQVLPNPATDGQTTIRYTLHKEGRVHIAVYNLSGQMETLLNTRQPPGHYSLNWQTTGKPAGVYIIKMNKKSLRVVVP